MHYLPQDPEHEHLRGDVRGWSPRVRLLAAAGVVLILAGLPAAIDARVAGVPVVVVLGALAFLLATIIILAGIPWRYLVQRWALFIPWIVLLTIAIPLGRGLTGWSTFCGIVGKAWLGFTTLLIVVRSTPVNDLFYGLRSLGVPSLLIATLATMDRYTFLFRDEFQRLRRAQAARSFRASRWFQIQTTAGMLGLVLARSYDRASRVHAAMQARGYRGTMPRWEHRAADQSD